MKRLHAAALTLVLAAGLGLAALVTAHGARAAGDWDWEHLPNGYSESVAAYHNPDPNGTTGTCFRVTIDGHYIGDTCTDADFQQKLNAYIDSTICTVNPAAGQQRGMCIPTTTNATTTTTPTGTDATTTTTPPAGETTTTPPTQTVTVTVTITDPAIDQRLTALEANYAALARRVDAIAQANTASWTAFIDATNAGASAADAAIAARSAGLNAIYQIA